MYIYIYVNNNDNNNNININIHKSCAGELGLISVVWKTSKNSRVVMNDAHFFPLPAERNNTVR